MFDLNEEVFSKVILDNRASILRICRAYAIPPLDTQDLYQDVVCEIWKSLANFEGKSELSTWIYRVTLNVCYRAHHTAKPKQQRTIQLDSIHYEPVAPENTDDDIRYAMLRECISVLEDIDRSIIMLQLEGLPYKTIAEITGLTANNVAVRVKRIKQKLFECILSKQAKENNDEQ